MPRKQPAGRLTIPKVNAALAAAGYPERLTRGDGYFYFYGGDASGWFQSGVYDVVSLGSITIEEWIAERNALANDPRNF